jgi:hypothetical protein
MGKPINISIVCQLVYFNRLELQIKYRYQTNLKPSIVTYSEIYKEKTTLFLYDNFKIILICIIHIKQISFQRTVLEDHCS